MPSSFTSSFSSYLRRVFLGLAATLGVGLIASAALVKYAVEPNDRVIQSLALVQSATASNAAFGDSHFAWGFVGSPEFPTFAAEGETIQDMELRVRYYFRDKPPGRVVLQGDPHSFAPYKLERATHAYLDHMGNSFWQRFNDHHRQYLGLYWERVMADGLDGFRQRNELRWGWIVGQEDWSAVKPDARVGLASARFRHQTPATDFEQLQETESYRRTLAFLKERGADICIVTSPVSFEYYTYASRNPGTVAAMDFFRQLAAQSGARYVNFFDLYARPEFAGYFRDMDHLNHVGAPRFTKKALSACFGAAGGPVAHLLP
jgi:hypothetical protein